MVLSRYETELLGVGWTRLERMGPVRGGFESRGFGEMASLVDKRQTAIVNLLDREAGGSDLRVRHNTAYVEEMLSIRPGMPSETSRCRCPGRPPV